MRTPIFAAATLAAALCAAGAPAPAHGQAAVLLRLRAGSPLSDRFRVDSSGAFVAYGFVRDVGNTTGCAAQLPATGAGTRFMWDPCRGSVRWGRVPTAQTNWDDANMDDFTFAGGNQVTASGYGAFAYGDQVTVSSTVGVGFGSGVTVSGTAGFSSGASNVCSGFACTAIGYTVRAGGQGSVALGYRTTANNDYSVAIGYRASNNTHTGTMAMGDESTTDSVRNQADNEFRIRYNGGIRLRVSTAANGNTPGAGGNVGCDLTVAVPSWTCASSRTLKENFVAVNGEDVLARIRGIPITTWNMIGGPDAARVRHLGPVAEDFYHAFALGLGETTIGLGDIDGVNLAGVKALEARTTDLQRQLNHRTNEVTQLRGEVEGLRADVAGLQAQVQALLAREAAAQKP
ncbi:tail fiber domain-containing protein [Longimicrobium sp.]|uniref:tail fiber domain-containing protein n=1 Tax=Longimicrobium sp. TaxID=2029185 RepID=UPI002CD88D16|nr:tail fiber domain-containing protein [Longimicrobium sp.]HSU17327.1 tail fiber domain-containing protein [Longimicrobium sp.]